MSSGTITTSGTGTGTVYADAKTKKLTTEDKLPKEKFCPNMERCFSRGIPKSPMKMYCDECGTKLEERIADMYIDLCYKSSAHTTVPYEYDEYEQSECAKEPNAPDNPAERKMRVGMKELVRMLKVYEKEVFVEDI